MSSQPFLNALNPDRLPLPEEAEPPDLAVGDSENGAALERLRDDPAGDRLLRFVVAHSDYLTSLIRREGTFLDRIVRVGPDAAVTEAVAAVAGLGTPAVSDSGAMRGLRIAKRRIALAAALADIAGLWPLPKVTGALCDLAEAALDCATVRALAAWRGVPETDGLAVLGMGKFGARELNYSSDIDLIMLYDPERLSPADPDRLRRDMVRVTRQILRMMDERTADGYVFRTDLRLRPDPSATPLAMTVHAAEAYYESVGQNWERAAMIKARPVAGDRALGRDFLIHIRPFIWRKHLDFAAIQNIHSIKRQTTAHRGGGHIAVEGHNIKIGRGGIREIEFYAQTQQLIWGGRQPNLRRRGTCEALDQLATNGHAKPEVVAELQEAYVFLRTLEHRLQMVADQQTQTLPDTPAAFAALARFMGEGDPDRFRDRVRRTLETVAGHYARLFEESPNLGAGGSLVFTGIEDDPDTLATLTRMGYDDPSHVAGRIRVWHHGRYRATRSGRSREILTELMPTLLRAFASTANPDDAFQRFDNFLAGLPSGVQLFSLFQAHPPLLELLSEILGGAPRLADWLSRKPILLDSVLSEDFYEPLDAVGPEDEELTAALDLALDFQDQLDVVRRWTNDRKFRIGVHLLRGITDGDRVGPSLSGLAEAGLKAILPAAEAEFADAHGRVPGDGMTVIAFGKLGGGELLPMSDLDLVFVYDVAEGAEASDGPKPIGPQVYYLRLCQRLITAITTETGEGCLYAADTRLRPSGRAGALATQRSGFESYYRLPDGEAWTWEHMALTRARPVYGEPALLAALETAIRDALVQPRDPARVLVDVDAMRTRMAREFPAKSDFDVKYRSGGLVDVEFIAQALQLIHAAARPDVLSSNTGTALERLGAAGAMAAQEARDLRDALALWRRLQAVIRLTAPAGDFDPDRAPDGQRRAFARAAGVDRFETLEGPMTKAADRVATLYRALIAEPAARYRAGTSR